jgi:hypothetical protein
MTVLETPPIEHIEQLEEHEAPLFFDLQSRSPSDIAGAFIVDHAMDISPKASLITQFGISAEGGFIPLTVNQEIAPASFVTIALIGHGTLFPRWRLSFANATGGRDEYEWSANDSADEMLHARFGARGEVLSVEKDTSEGPKLFLAAVVESDHMTEHLTEIDLGKLTAKENYETIKAKHDAQPYPTKQMKDMFKGAKERVKLPAFPETNIKPLRQI